MPADAATIAAVRRVVADWDGENWSAVAAAIEAGGTARPIRELTVADVRAIFAVRQRDFLIRLGGAPHTTDGSVRAVSFADEAGEAASFTVAALREISGLSSDTLRKYARAAGVDVPARGKRNHAYTAAEARAILARIAADAGEARTRERCARALGRLGFPRTGNQN
ncbi:MAG: hypothetical protein IPM13_10005 [Phycisphaerales bacterium]|nr:hypothetical protein [Phycisphaerales bacterium]